MSYVGAEKKSIEVERNSPNANHLLQRKKDVMYYRIHNNSCKYLRPLHIKIE